MLTPDKKRGKQLNACKFTKRKNGWTPREDALICELAAKGIPNDDIAKHFPNRTLAAVKRRRATLGVKPKKWFTHTNLRCVAELVKFRMAGYRQKDIAKLFGVTQRDVSWVLCKAGFKRFQNIHILPDPGTKRYWTELEIHRLRKLLMREVPIKQIYPKFPNRTHRAVRKKVYQLTKYWPTPEERAAREAFERKSAAKQLKVDWDAPRKEHTPCNRIHSKK